MRSGCLRGDRERVISREVPFLTLGVVFFSFLLQHRYKVSGTFERPQEKSNLSRKSERNIKECRIYLV